MHAPRRDEQHGGNVAAQVQQRVQLDGPFALAERRPGKERQTQVDDGRIQGIDRLLQFDPEGLGGIERARRRDQPLGEVGIDPPVAHLVGMGQGVAGDGAPEAHVVAAWAGPPAGRPQCPAGSRDRSAGQRPCTGTDPSRRSSGPCSGPRSGPRRCGTRTGRRSPSVARRSSGHCSRACSSRENARVWPADESAVQIDKSRHGIDSSVPSTRSVTSAAQRWDSSVVHLRAHRVGDHGVGRVGREEAARPPSSVLRGCEPCPRSVAADAGAIRVWG